MLVLTDKQLVQSMNVSEQTPLLRITSLSYSDNGEFLNYSVMPASIRWTTICGVSTRKIRYTLNSHCLCINIYQNITRLTRHRLVQLILNSKASLEMRMSLFFDDF